MEDPSSRLSFLFDRYLRRRCSPQELEELIALLQQDQLPGSLRERLKALWEKVKDEPANDTVDWENMYRRITESGQALPAMRQSRTRTWLGIAAGLLVLLGGTLFYRYSHDHPGNPAGPVQPLTANSLPRNMPGTDKKQTIHLPDGSTVILNTNSHLDYPSAFTGRTREVYLSGEAYFDIKRDPKKPFLVHAGKIVTRVLGTAFDIRAYPGDESIRVTVTRGKVQVLKENKSLGTIAANQQISFSLRTEMVLQQVVDTRPLVAWKPQEISFNDISMAEAADSIRQRFGMTVEFTNPAIKNCRVTATFSEDDMLDEILAVICGVTRSDYMIQNNKIIINGKGCTE